MYFFTKSEIYFYTISKVYFFTISKIYLFKSTTVYARVSNYLEWILDSTSTLWYFLISRIYISLQNLKYISSHNLKYISLNQQPMPGFSTTLTNIFSNPNLWYFMILKTCQRDQLDFVHDWVINKYRPNFILSRLLHALVGTIWYFLILGIYIFSQYMKCISSHYLDTFLLQIQAQLYIVKAAACISLAPFPAPADNWR